MQSNTYIPPCCNGHSRRILLVPAIGTLFSAQLPGCIHPKALAFEPASLPAFTSRRLSEGKVWGLLVPDLSLFKDIIRYIKIKFLSSGLENLFFGKKKIEHLLYKACVNITFKNNKSKRLYIYPNYIQMHSIFQVQLL